MSFDVLFFEKLRLRLNAKNNKLLSLEIRRFRLILSLHDTQNNTVNEFEYLIAINFKYTAATCADVAPSPAKQPASDLTGKLISTIK